MDIYFIYLQIFIFVSLGNYFVIFFILKLRYFCHYLPADDDQVIELLALHMAPVETAN